MTVRRELDGGVDSIDLGPGEAMINPRNVWHTADVAEPGRFMTITPEPAPSIEPVDYGVTRGEGDAVEQPLEVAVEAAVVALVLGHLGPQRTRARGRR